MSVRAMRWAFEIQGVSSSQKLVLLALANRADELDQCFPSIRQIRLDTCLKADTICGATRALEQAGLLERQRRHNNSTVYRLLGVPGRHQIPEAGNSRNRGPAIPETGNSAYPETGNVNQIETKPKPKKARGARKSDTGIVPDGINADAWCEWITYRKQSRKPMTPATIKLQVAFLRRYTHDEHKLIIEQSITAGWQGLFELKNASRRNGNGEAHQRSDSSAAGRVRAAVARERASWSTAPPDRGSLVVDGEYVRQ